MPSYPFACTLTNPGAESGNATGWTAVNGTFTATPAALSSGTNSVNAHSGAFYFTGASNAAFCWWGQTITLDSSVLTDVDAGQLKAVFSAWRIGFTDADSSSLNIECFDGSGNWLAGRYGTQTDPTAWTPEFLGIRVPPNTRSIRISVRGVRASGTELSAYIDDMALTLYKDGLTIYSIPYAQQTITTTGWTNVSSTVTAGAEPVGFTTDTVLYFSTGPNCEAYKTISFSTSPETTLIDSGSGFLMIYMRVSGFTDTDNGRTYIECYDTSNALIGSRIYSVAANFHPNQNGQDGTFSVALPVGTRSVRLGIVATRVSGTTTDFHVSYPSVFLMDGSDSAYVVDQLGLEVWASYEAEMRLDQLGTELWGVYSSKVRVSQVVAEVWRSTSYTNTQAQFSQTGIEIWNFYDFVPRRTIKTTVTIMDS